MSYIETPYPVAIGGTGSNSAGGARTNLSVPSTTEAVLVTGANAFTGNQSMGSNKLTNLATPTAPGDAASKAYVDALATGGVSWHEAVRAATTANITLSGAQTIDGVSVIAGDRVLVKDQSTGADNGIYVVAAGAWAYASDWYTGNVASESAAFVQEGTANGGSGWTLSTTGTITVGTTSIAFVQFTGLGQITAGAGLTQTGNTIDAVGTSNRITVNANNIDISATYVGQSSITTLGTIATGTWQSTSIAVLYGGTGGNSASTARSNLAAAPNTATYIVASSNGELANADVATAGTGILLTPSTNVMTFAVDTTVVVTLTGTQTLTNKTLTSPTINTPNILRQTAYKTASYTLTATDEVVTFRVTTSSQVANLPVAAVGNLGKTYLIKNHNSSTQSIDIVPNGSDILEGVNANFTVKKGYAYEATCIYNGSTYEWIIS